jgi:hypothetical protein
MEVPPVLVRWWLSVAVAVVHSGEPVDREHRVVAPEVTPPRPLERRLKASGEPTVRPTMVMLLGAAVVVLAPEEPGGFTELILGVFNRTATPVATAA